MPQCVHLICNCLGTKTTPKLITGDPIVWISEHDKVWGMPQCAHPLGRRIRMTLIPGYPSKASWYMKRPSWMWGPTQIMMLSVTWWNGLLVSQCKNWCHHARIGPWPNMNITNQQAEGVLDSLDSLHHLSLIVDQRRIGKMEKQCAILDIPQEMEPCRHPVLQSIDGAYPNEMHRSKHKISWP